MTIPLHTHPSLLKLRVGRICSSFLHFIIHVSKCIVTCHILKEWNRAWSHNYVFIMSFGFNYFLTNEEKIVWEPTPQKWMAWKNRVSSPLYISCYRLAIQNNLPSNAILNITVVHEGAVILPVQFKLCRRGGFIHNIFQDSCSNAIKCILSQRWEWDSLNMLHKLTSWKFPQGVDCDQLCILGSAMAALCRCSS